MRPLFHSRLDSCHVCMEDTDAPTLPPLRQNKPITTLNIDTHPSIQLFPALLIPNREEAAPPPPPTVAQRVVEAILSPVRLLSPVALALSPKKSARYVLEGGRTVGE